MALEQHDPPHLSRRALLKSLGVAPFLLRAAPFYGSSPAESFSCSLPALPDEPAAISFDDVRLVPHYPARSPLEDVLRLVPPGSDAYITEAYAFEVAAILKRWSAAFRSGDLSALAGSLDSTLQASTLSPSKVTSLRSGFGLDCSRREFSADLEPGADRLLQQFTVWLGEDAKVETAEFEITSIEVISDAPLSVRLEIRYGIVSRRGEKTREERTGSWLTEWSRAAAPGEWKLRRLQANQETMSLASGPGFVEVTRQALGSAPSYTEQLLRGADYWRTVLDGACGIDVYGNNGVSAGDFDNDGFDDLYICQPAGLPNRLYRNRGDGTFDDVTEKAGVGVLDNTACALFADFRNVGLQDLLVVCSSGPLLFLNQGNVTFTLKRDAFQFATPPQGSFTHAAIADYDRDGRLDIYFCLYSYYLGLDQYHYPAPYFDARNGPPNFLLHNQGGGVFVDRTAAAGLQTDNDRYSFACAWGESLSNNLPDLYVANDFGRNTFYRNNGDGTFTATSSKSHVEDVGAGMSACWADYDNDGRPDLYVANMWSAAGQRVSQQQPFHPEAPDAIRALYQRHARGNSLYRNHGDGVFSNVADQAGVEMGRWAWGSDFWDFDHDGYPDLYVTNGYISSPRESETYSDLGSFFWRQVVGRSPNDATPSQGYERGWNALNELIRSDNSWSGFERNVMFANNRDGTFSQVSGVVGLDFLEDSRSFALADLDHDGRLEVIVKNRNAPQLRILHNDMQQLGGSIAFRLKGTKSNRDGIGAAITLESSEIRQTRYLQAGTGFLAQHTKEVFFGLGQKAREISATVRWPSGLTQQFDALPPNSRITIEEGSANLTIKPFAAPAPAYSKAAAAPAPESLPTQIATWLINPLKAPEFSLPDLTGAQQTLASFRGGFVLLYFWATGSPLCRSQLKLLQQQRAQFATRQVSAVSVNLDSPELLSSVRALAAQEQLAFPVLLATQEVAGVYNIVYRYLFDRRRDLAIPTSFLIDKEGMIVAVYQGELSPERVLEDIQSIPETADGRVQRALPFPGTLYQGQFQRNDFTFGIAMFQHGYLEQAAASFEQVIANKPDDAEGYYNLGTLNLRRNDFQQARQYLEQALKRKPDYPEAWNNLGMMAAQQGHPEQAIDNFQQSLRLRPSYATALLNLGNVYRRNGQIAVAQQTLTRALALEPDDPEANYSMGMFYAQQGQLQQASEYLEKAIALRPDYPEALNNLGVLFVRQQNYAEAEARFRSCIRMAPQFDQSYLNLARLYAVEHEKDKARQALEDLLRLQPDNAGAKQGLATLESMP